MEISVYPVVIMAMIGLVAYVFSAHPKVSEIGRILFFVGLLALVLGVHSLAHLTAR